MKKNLNYKAIVIEDCGSAVVIAMLTLLVVTIIGVGTLNNSITERTVSTNEMLYKQAFYAADGGTTMVEKLIEQNIISFNGFDKTTDACQISDPLTQEELVYDGYYCSSNNPYSYIRFWTNSEIMSNPWCYPSAASDDRDFFVVSESSDTTSFKVGYVPKFSAGAAIQMAAGYEGKGKSLSQSGHYMMYDIYAQHDNPARNVKATLLVNWRFVD
jgi:Na+-transporting methylmalonyl-CoA/oxaloacetate decarboxylase gamma subunit